MFRALSPCFDGQHSLLEMMWRQDLSQAEVDAALRAFSDLVVTVQRRSRRACVWPLYKSVVIFEKSPQNPFLAANCGRYRELNRFGIQRATRCERRKQTSGRSKRSKAHSAALRSVGKARGLLA